MSDSNEQNEIDHLWQSAWRRWPEENFQAAIDDFTRIIELDPEHTLVWNGRGLALHNLKRFEEALEAYTRATELDPKDAKAWHNRGDALEKLTTRTRSKPILVRLNLIRNTSTPGAISDLF